MSIKSTFIFIAAALTVSGCATTPPERSYKAPEEKAVATMMGEAATEVTVSSAVPASAPEPAQKVGKGWLSITPMTNLRADFSTFPDSLYDGAYTRLVVTNLICSDAAACSQIGKPDTGEADEVFKYKERNMLLRWLWGIRHTINLSTKVSVGDFVATVPLVTIDHISNRTDGEVFVRTIQHSAADFPLFLVNSSSRAVQVKFEVRTTDESTLNVAGTAIQIAQSTAKALSPQSAVLNTLTKEKTKDIANSLDKAISQLLAKQVAETPESEQHIVSWKNGLTNEFAIPKERAFKWDHDSDYQIIGNWKVAFENPRPSIFSNVQICTPPSGVTRTLCEENFKNAALRAQSENDDWPEGVLAFKLVDGIQTLGSVESYLKQKDWWTTAHKAFATAGKTPAMKKNDAIAFCVGIKGAIARLNLNKVDAGIVAVAVKNSANLPSELAKAMDDYKQACGHARL